MFKSKTDGMFKIPKSNTEPIDAYIKIDKKEYSTICNKAKAFDQMQIKPGLGLGSRYSSPHNPHYDPYRGY